MAATRLTEQDVAARLGVSVKTLMRIMARVPTNLPGAPLIVHGDGGRSGKPRCRRRWNPATVDQWLDAVAHHLGGDV